MMNTSSFDIFGLSDSRLVGWLVWLVAKVVFFSQFCDVPTLAINHPQKELTELIKYPPNLASLTYFSAKHSFQ
jgi:hypothetical protein